MGEMLTTILAGAVVVAAIAIAARLIITAVNRACMDVLTALRGAVEEMREDRFESLAEKWEAGR
jgi:hypothetical protein